jgi:hypothetical protein
MISSLGFLTYVVLRGEVLASRSTPNLEDRGYLLIDLSGIGVLFYFFSIDDPTGSLHFR